MGGSWVIVLSIAPGIRSLAWAIVSLPKREIRGELLGFDLEHHGNKRFTVETFEDMLARSKVHWLILEVLLGRYSPGVLVMAGQASSREPPEHAEGARCLLRSLFLGVGIPVLEFGDRDEVLRLLAITARQTTAEASRFLGGHVPTRKRELVQTFLAAAAAGRVLFELPTGPLVSYETGILQPAKEVAPDESSPKRSDGCRRDGTDGPRMLVPPPVATVLDALPSAPAGSRDQGGVGGRDPVRRHHEGRRAGGRVDQR
jgi:hypothetical protein